MEASEPTKNPSLTPEYRTSLKPKSKPSVSPSEPRSTKSWENNEENRKMKMDSTSHYLRSYFSNGMKSLPQTPIGDAAQILIIRPQIIVLQGGKCKGVPGYTDSKGGGGCRLPM